jgi:hypothetical protein
MSNNLSLGLSILKKNTIKIEQDKSQIKTFNTLNEFLLNNQISINTQIQKYNVWFHDANEPDFSLDKFYKISDISNIEEYIIINQLLKDNYKMLLNGMFFIMKDNIKPVWNDDANRNGGCISWKIEKYNSIDYWENLLMLLITNNLPEELNKYKINGISINPKKNCNIIKLWLSNDIEGNILNKIDLTDKCLFKDNLKLYKSFKKFL